MAEERDWLAERKQRSARHMLVAAGVIQLVLALLGTMLLMDYLSASEEPGRIPMWLCAPAGLLAAVFVLLRQRWAWYASLLLLPLYPLAPYFDVTHLTSSLHGGEAVLVLCIPMAIILDIIVGTLLVMGRSGLKRW